MTNPNDPAFTGPTDSGFASGLTKREYFTGMALQGLCANKKFMTTGCDSELINVSATAVEIADFVILTLNEEE